MTGVSDIVEQIKEGLAAIRTHVVNENWIETYFKIIHNAIYGFNLPPSPLYPNRLLTCPKCGTPLTDMWHGIWQCPIIQNFWKEILQLVENHYKTVLRLHPDAVTPEVTGTAKKYPYLSNPGLLHVTLLIAKRCITNCLSSPTPPTLHMIVEQLKLYLMWNHVKSYTCGTSPRTRGKVLKKNGRHLFSPHTWRDQTSDAVIQRYKMVSHWATGG